MKGKLKKKMTTHDGQGQLLFYIQIFKDERLTLYEA